MFIKHIELAEKQVRVNSVNPGDIVTNICLASGITKTKEEDDKVFNQKIQYLLLKILNIKNIKKIVLGGHQKHLSSKKNWNCRRYSPSYCISCVGLWQFYNW